MVSDWNRRCISIGLALTVAVVCSAKDLSIGQATLSVGAVGVPGDLRFADGGVWRSRQSGPICYLESAGRRHVPTLLTVADGELHVVFEDGSTARFVLQPARGFTLFRLTNLDLHTSATRLGLCRLPVPEGADISGTLNACFHEGHVLSVMAADPDVHAFQTGTPVRRADRRGCRHEFTQTTESHTGRHAARFAASCNSQPAGWSMRGAPLPRPLDVGDWVGVSAWVHGDGAGEQLKIQLVDETGGARDYYVPVNFTGWRHVEVTTASLDTLRAERIVGINLYYNGLPASRSVVCLIDDIRGIVRRQGQAAATVSVENFEETESVWWGGAGRSLTVETEERYGLHPATFGIIACPESEFLDTVERFEAAAGIPSPRPGGAWNKRSQLVRESYLFLTSFSEAQFDKALVLARRGGFRRVLLGQESWCKATGHFEVSRTNFPEGLPALVRTVKRFREAGIDVGLHFLAASIYPPDSYLAPVPDPRLVKGARATLAADIDEATKTILLEQAPLEFPAEDGGYEGRGTILQIDEELIAYDTPTTTLPFGFSGCRRGHLGTRAARHARGATVHHLTRAYGYHLHDMDTSLLDEVTSHFAAVANACDIGMIYFDGAERLQGDHWRYNARLIKAFHDKLARKDILLQASSFTHYSWHMLARSASADGHGDLKGYLEQRAPFFAIARRDGMPLDIGWYYGYETSATPDMYEYILGTTIGYSASMSYQVSVDAAGKHPFTGEILDLIARYEKLRLSGRVPDAMRERLRVDAALAGQPPEAPNRPTWLRRDYRLVDVDGVETFQRVVYEPWHEMAAGAREITWQTHVTSGPALVGLQVEALPRPASGDTKTTSAPCVEDIWMEAAGQRIEWKGQIGEGQYLFVWPGEPIALYGLPLSQPERQQVNGPMYQLPAGDHVVGFGCAAGSGLSLRVRLTFQPPERHAIPPTSGNLQGRRSIQ